MHFKSSVPVTLLLRPAFPNLSTCGSLIVAKSEVSILKDFLQRLEVFRVCKNFKVKLIEVVMVSGGRSRVEGTANQVDETDNGIGRLTLPERSTPQRKKTWRLFHNTFIFVI